MSKKESRARRLPPVQFGMAGLVIGVAAGMLAGLAVEIASGQYKFVLMQLGGLAGLMVGSLVEAVRFWWRKSKRGRSEPPKD